MDQYSKESQFTTLPVTKGERQLGMLDSTLINTGWGIATWCFLTGGLLASLVDFKTALITCFVGNTLGVMLCALASTLPCAKYGIDTYTSIISFLGRNGMKIVLGIFLITNIGWVVVLASMMARSVQNIYETAAGAPSPGWTFPVITVLAVLLTWALVVKGPQALKIMNRIMVPGLLIVVVIMLAELVLKFDMGQVLATAPLAPYESKALNIIFALELNLGAGISWWPGLGGLARLNKTSSSAFWGNVIGLSFACVAMCMLSVCAAFAIGGSDPTTWMIPLGGVALGIVALIFVMLANMTSNSYVMYNTCLGLKQYSFLANKSWLFVTGFFTIPVVVASFFPEFVYGNYQMLLNFCVALFGPLSALQILDYYVFRRKALDLRAIYDKSQSSNCTYTQGVHWAAVVIFVISVFLYCLLLNPITWEYSAIFPYTTAFIPSTAFCLVAYYMYGKLYVVPKNFGNIEYYKNTAKGGL